MRCNYTFNTLSKLDLYDVFARKILGNSCSLLLASMKITINANNFKRVNFVFAVPVEVKAQYEDNIKWIEEAQQHHLVSF